MMRNRKIGAAREPLITENLEDLNRELELLKKKRLMIEQRQQMFSDDRFGRKQQYNYNKSHQKLRQQEPGRSKELNNDYSFFDYYDERPSDHFTRSGRKRQSSDPHWQANVPNKRFAGSQGSKHKESGSNRGQRSMNRNTETAAPLPLLGKGFGFKPYAVNRPTQANATKTSYNDFKPNKITKPKPAPVSNRLHTYTSNEVESLVTSPSKSVQKVGPVLTSEIYHADKEPTKQMTGRMELALGAILKEIKATFSASHSTAMNSTHVLRHLKQNIRERIRSIMLGKPVGKSTEIVEAYRAKFPKETDEEILEFSVDCVQANTNKRLILRLEDTENPKEFFETNIRYLLRNRLDVMFKKLKIMYEKEYKTTRDDDSNALLTNLNNSKETASTSTDFESASKGNLDASVIIVEDKGDNKNKIIIIDDENGDLKAKCSDEKASEISKPQQNEDSKINNSANETEKEKSESDFYKELIEEIIARQLPENLSIIKNKIVEILCYDRIFKFTRASIIMNTQNKLKLPSQNKDSNNITQKQIIKPEPKSTLNSPTVIPYFVRITGKPYLPKRKQMQKFLFQFNASTVKKHRNLPHLLFVGFSEKENFDKILAANDTIVANSKLTIKISERVNNKNKMNSQENTNENADTALTKNKEESNIDFDFINPELDGKIDELISSIRKEQEEMETNTDCETYIINFDNVNDVEKDVKNGNNSEITKTVENTNSNASESKPDNVVSNIEVGENIKCGGISDIGNNPEIAEILSDSNAENRPPENKPDSVNDIQVEENVCTTENNPEISEILKDIEDDDKIDLTGEDNEEGGETEKME